MYFVYVTTDQESDKRCTQSTHGNQKASASSRARQTVGPSANRFLCAINFMVVLTQIILIGVKFDDNLKFLGKYMVYFGK